MSSITPLTNGKERVAARKALISAIREARSKAGQWVPTGVQGIEVQAVKTMSPGSGFAWLWAYNTRGEATLIARTPDGREAHIGGQGRQDSLVDRIMRRLTRMEI